MNGGMLPNFTQNISRMIHYIGPLCGQYGWTQETKECIKDLLYRCSCSYMSKVTKKMKTIGTVMIGYIYRQQDVTL